MNQFEKTPDVSIKAPKPEKKPRIKETVVRKVKGAKTPRAKEWAEIKEESAREDEARVIENARVRKQIDENARNSREIEKKAVERKETLSLYQNARKILEDIFNKQKSEEGKPLAKKGDPEKNMPLVETIMARLKNHEKGMKFSDVRSKSIVRRNAEGNLETKDITWEVKHDLKKDGKFDFILVREDNGDIKHLSASELESKLIDGELKLNL